MVKEYKPPEFPTNLNEYNSRVSIFLAGSIEMGDAPDWQSEFKRILEKKGEKYKEYTLLNPRRDDWNKTLEQSITEPAFFQQVMWELEHLEKATARVFYFAGDTLSPISLLEFGKFYHLKNTFVCWDKRYKRRGNLEIFCHKYGIRAYDTLEDLVKQIVYVS